jgi:peptidoglycan/LPS O-acetylase OafA/YrhL
MFGEHFPRLFAQFMRARQQADRFDVAPLNYLHVPVAALAIAGIAGALIFRRRLNIAPEAAALCLTILLALAANAAICGIFAHPVDRYQSRLVLLAPLAVALLIAQRQHAGLNRRLGSPPDIA